MLFLGVLSSFLAFFRFSHGALFGALKREAEHRAVALALLGTFDTQMHIFHIYKHSQGRTIGHDAFACLGR